VPKFQSVVTMSGSWLISEAEFMQYGIHEVARTISSKGAAGAVGSMRAGSESEDKNAGVGIAKS
jgi:hypothetical protein